MDIAFIGLGHMGSAMVPNLVAAGHRVAVWNRSPEAAARLEGVELLASPAAAFEREAVFSMLAHDVAVRDVIVETRAYAAARPGCVHVSLSTISPELVSELDALHRAAGTGFVAAPVFGVPAVAARAELNIVVAGEPASVARVQPLLDVLGRQTFPMGEDPARAAIVKIAGNLMITMAMEAMGEASALTELYGVSASDFLGMVTQTMFASPSYQRYGGSIASRTYDPGFALTLGLKDVDLALDAAAARGATLAGAEIVGQNMRAGIARGDGARDWSIVAREARLRAGLGDDVA
jgi:3-hydroxyisobutyrate dehydrogenase-like beta-hydroxyacid dehydrogenase